MTINPETLLADHPISLHPQNLASRTDPDDKWSDVMTAQDLIASLDKIGPMLARLGLLPQATDIRLAIEALAELDEQIVEARETVNRLVEKITVLEEALKR